MKEKFIHNHWFILVLPVYCYQPTFSLLSYTHAQVEVTPWTAARSGSSVHGTFSGKNTEYAASLSIHNFKKAKQIEELQKFSY